MMDRLFKCLSFIILLLLSVISANAQKSISGIVTEELKTKDGKFSILHTSHLPKGKIISGTVISEAESDKQNKKQKQTENLNKYIIKFAGEIIKTNGIFSLQLPDTKEVPLQFFSPEGKLLNEISLFLSEPAMPSELKLPKTIRKEYTEKISGNFSGDISEAKVFLDETSVNVIAGNESELFFESADIDPGKHELSLEYDEVETAKTINLVDYSLQAGRLTLNRGESTYLDIKVVGLEDLQEPLSLDVQNQMVGRISLEGGDLQTIQIIPEEVALIGIWEKRFEIQSLSKGSFSINTKLEIPEHEIDKREDIWENIEVIGKKAKIFK